MKKEVGMMLKVENLNVHYGVIHAIEDVNIEVRDGEIVTLIGANGAGKTTILHTITGLKKATSGSVVFDGTDLLKEQPSKIITHGEQQMLAVGRALMADPKIILMDEPSMGLSPLLVQEIFSIIKEVNAQGITVLLVEQNAKMALKVANRAYVLETGKNKLSGDAQELLHNDEVRKAYLGA